MEKGNGEMVKIVEVCKIPPPSSSHSSSSNFGLPLTEFDWCFMNFPPIERVFFYERSDTDPFFETILIPRLKRSLSLTLQHFLPVAGNLLWPHHSPDLPFILCSPNDALSFTVAESHFDFHDHVSANSARKLKHSQPFIPNMIQTSDSAAPLMAIQVTKFPNHGFSIGFAAHHVLFDGTSFNIFVKSWAHICNQLDLELDGGGCCFPLPTQLTPSFDRGSLIPTPFDFVPQNRTLKFSPRPMPPPDWIRATFELTPTHIHKLKQRVLEYSHSMENQQQQLHLSTFVVAYAYVFTCLINTKQGECKEHVYLTLAANVRGLLDPPVSANYLGNCVNYPGKLVEAREFREEGGGFQKIAYKISDMILDLRRSRTMEVHKPFDDQEEQHKGIEVCSMAASPKFKFYETDFGWGKPIKFEMVSLENNNISLTDTRHGGGGIEVGIILPNHHQLHIFASLFSKGLN